MSGKRKIIVNSKEIESSKNNSLKYYQFQISKYLFQIIKCSSEIFDLTIDGQSFDNLMNEEKTAQLKLSQKKEQISHPKQIFPINCTSSYLNDNQLIKKDEEYARYLQNQYNNEFVNSGNNNDQKGNYKKPIAVDSLQNKFREDVKNDKNIEELNLLQRNTELSRKMFQYNKNILSNIENVFGEIKGEEVGEINMKKNMDILGNLDMDNILGCENEENAENKEILDFDGKRNVEVCFMNFKENNNGSMNQNFINNSGMKKNINRIGIEQNINFNDILNQNNQIHKDNNYIQHNCQQQYQNQNSLKIFSQPFPNQNNPINKNLLSFQPSSQEFNPSKNNSKVLNSNPPPLQTIDFHQSFIENNQKSSSNYQYLQLDNNNFNKINNI